MLVSNMLVTTMLVTTMFLICFYPVGNPCLSQAEEERRREEAALGEAVNSLVMNTLGGGGNKDVLDEDVVSAQ